MKFCLTIFKVLFLCAAGARANVNQCVTLAWNPPAGATSQTVYTLEVAAITEAAQGFSYSEAAIPLGNCTSVVFVDLQPPATTFFFAVVDSVGICVSDDSNIVEWTP